MKIISMVTQGPSSVSDPWGGLQNPAGSSLSTWEGVLSKVYDVLNQAVPLSALVAVVMIIVGGFTYITAAGDPDKIEKGGKIITAAIIGMVLIFLSKMIIGFVIDRILPT